MKLTLKSTIFISSIIAVGLNVAQFTASAAARRDALDANLATAAPTTPGPAVNKLTATRSAATVKRDPTPTPTNTTPAGPNPGPTDAAVVAHKLAAAGLNPTWAGLYLSVAQATGTPWQILAAVHHVESGQSGSTARTSYAGATGPMQFMPATFRAYATDGNGDGVKDIHNIDDAMLTAGRYLAADGASRGQYSTALYHYNHSSSYVAKVTALAKQLGL